MLQHKPIRYTTAKLHQLCFPSFLNRNIRNDFHHFRLIVHFYGSKCLYQSIPVFTSKLDMILVLREIILRCQIVAQCHSATFRQAFIHLQCSFRRSIADNIQTIHFDIRIKSQIINHCTYFSQLLGIIHILRTNIHLIHLKVQESFGLHIAALYLLHHRFHIRQIRSYYVRYQHSFKCNLIKSMLHIHQSTFTATTFITLHIQPGICHPCFIRQHISVLNDTTLLLCIFLYPIREFMTILLFPAHHCQSTFINQVLIASFNRYSGKIISSGRRNQLRNKVHPTRRFHFHILQNDIQIHMNKFTQLFQSHRLYSDSTIV